MIGPDSRPGRYARPAAAALLIGLAALAAPAHAQTELWSATLTAAEFTYGGDTYTGFKQAGGGDSTRAGALTKETFSYEDRTVLITFIGRRHSDAALEIHSFEDLRALGASWTLHATPAGGTTTQLAFADLQVEEGNILVIELYWPNPGVNWQAADQVALKILTAEAGAPENLTATGGEWSATLSWSAPAGVPPSPITGYRYRVRGPGADEWGGWTDIPDSAGLREYEVEGLLAEGQHRFQLAAVNAVGRSGLYATTEAFVEAMSPPPLRSGRPCAGAKWCATLTVGGFDAGGTDVTGYRGVDEPMATGTVSSGAFRFKGTDYTVKYLHHETTPAEDGHTLFFATDPALPADEKELTLDVGGRRFQLRDAGRTAVPAAGGGGAPYAWSSETAPVVTWPDDNTVSVRLFAPRGLVHGSRLHPAELDAGDRFRLLFVTGDVVPDPIAGTSVDAEHYNDIVRQRVKNGSHRDNPIASFAGGFTALASTPFVAARDNAGTTHREQAGAEQQPAYAGVPIYWLNGDPDDAEFLKRKVADDYADFHDGDWDDETHPKDEWGDGVCLNPPCAQVLVSTGSLANGSADPVAPFGAPEIRAGALNHDEAQGPIASGRENLTYEFCTASAFNRGQCDIYGEDYYADHNIYEDTPVVTVPQWQRQFLYGLSPVFEIRATAPTVWNVEATRGREAEIELTWKLRDNGSPITDLRIQRRGDNRRWRDLASIADVEARSHLVEDDTCPGTFEYYRVVAENAVGATASKSATGWSRAGDGAAPGPVDLTATSRDPATIELRWRLEGCRTSVTRLTVAHAPDGVNYGLVAQLDRDARSHVHEGVSCGLVRPIYLVTTDFDDGTDADAEVLAPLAPCPTAELVADSLPARHASRNTTFTVRVQFSEDIHATDLCPAMDVTNGACSASRPVGDGADLWEFEIAPDGRHQVTLALGSPSDCGLPDAVCTAYGHPVENTITTTIPGPPPLTAQFYQLPATHNGTGTVVVPRVRVVFSRNVDATDLCPALTVTGGTCDASRVLSGTTAVRWEFDIVPTGNLDVTITLDSPTDCTAADAVCTPDGSPLSNELTDNILGPALSAAFVSDSLPASHGGAGTTFTVRVIFTLDVDATDLCPAMIVQEGECDSSAKVESRDDLWEFTIAPDGDAAVALQLANTETNPVCSQANTVCTSDGVKLTIPTTAEGIPGPPASMQSTPLTAAFVAGSLPANHGGADTTFTARIQFNQDADVEDLCAALTMTDGTCSGSAKVGDDASLWELTIAPDASKPVTVALGTTTDCAATGAICTSDDTPLSTAISTTVSPPLLESAWESLPDDHAGADTTFTAQVRFSEDVDIIDLCAAFEVTNGTCESSSKVGDDADLWEIEIAPDGAADVSLTLGITTDCDAAGAVCTSADTPLSYGVFAVVSRRPLTVALVSLPEDHGGVDTTFTVQLRFSEAVDVDDLCDAVSLLDATCGSSARDADDADLWEVVVAPDGAPDVFFVLADKDCGHDDAVCTADGAQLSNGLLEYVPRRPFTAAWVETSVPANHDGAGTEFTVRVQFSEDAIVSYLVLRDEALEVTNGTGTKFRRVDGRNDLREATIVPDGTADVTLVLDSPTDCDASDAVCTKDDSPLTTRLALSVPGPS